MTVVCVTEDLLRSGQSDNGGWSNRQLKMLGVSLPLRKGWKTELIGTVLDKVAADEFVALKNAHLNKGVKQASGSGPPCGPPKPRKKQPKIRKEPKRPKLWDVRDYIPAKDQYQHPNWQMMRLAILKRDGFRCRICNDDSSMLHVHHRTYDGRRYIWDVSTRDLITLCHSCHELFHNKGTHP